MNPTGKYIAELLKEHDCVVVPGIGGFVANYVPAQINGSQHLISPPSKKIVFNSKLKNNDGLLTEYIAQAEQKTFSEATILLNHFANDAVQQLQNGKHVLFEGVGSLSMGDEKNILFNPDTEQPLLLSSFGFDTIRALPVTREERKVKENVFVNREAKPTNRTKVLKRVLPLAVLPLLAVVLSLPFLTGVIKEDKINFSRINPFYNAPDPIYSPADFFEPYNPPAKHASLFDYEAAGRTVKYSFASGEVSDSTAIGVIVSLGEAKEEVPETITPEKVNAITEKKYHIIGGAFQYTDFAEDFLADLRRKGFNAYILNEPNEDLTKVSYEGFSTRREALNKLRDIQSENPDAWVYKY